MSLFSWGGIKLQQDLRDYSMNIDTGILGCLRLTTDQAAYTASTSSDSDREIRASPVPFP